MEIGKLGNAAISAGSTSAFALLAATGQASADGPYVGIAFGAITGEHPSPGASDSEDYELAGSVTSFYAGVEKTLESGMFVGVEVAYTGAFEGDDADDSGYEYAYDIDYNIDAKLRVGTTLGSAKVYGFGGLSVGSSNGCCYGNDYRYEGINIGAGVEMEMIEDVMVGVEWIHRETTGTIDDGSGDDWGYRASHDAIALRVGFQF